MADGYLSPLTLEKLQPPFSMSLPRSSLISPPPPPARSQVVRLNFPPSSSSRRAQIRSRRSRNRSSTSLRIVLMPLLLGDGRAHLGGEILGLLLQPLAERHADESSDVDVLADHRDGVGDLLLDGALALGVLDEGLLEEAPLLEELLQLAGEDLLQHRLRLALLEELGAVDLLLVLEGVGRHFLAPHPFGAHRRNLHGDVLHQLLELLVAGGEVRLAVHLHEDADLAAHVDVVPDHALGGGATRLLPRGGEPLLAQPVGSLAEVARALLQRLLAIHHPRAALLAELLHQCGCHLCHVRATSFLGGLGLVARGCGGGFAGLCGQLRLLHHLDLGASLATSLPAAHPPAHAHATAAAPSAALAAALATALARLVAVIARRLAALGLLAPAVRRVAGLPLDGRIPDLRAEEPDRADGVVVPGNDVVDPFRIAVRVDEPHDGNPEAGGLVDGDVLLLRIDHEEAARKPRHLLDAAQVLLQLVHLVLQDGDFLLGQLFEGAVARHLLERLQAVDAALDGLEVGQRPAQPAVRHVELARAGRLLDDGVLGLLLRPDEEHGPALRADVRDELESLAREADGLLQIDDVDPVPRAEDVGLHLRVPAFRLVPEVHPCLEQLAHGDSLRGLHRLLHAGRLYGRRGGLTGFYVLRHAFLLLHLRRARWQAPVSGNPARIGRCVKWVLRTTKRPSFRIFFPEGALLLAASARGRNEGRAAVRQVLDGGAGPCPATCGGPLRPAHI